MKIGANVHDSTEAILNALPGNLSVRLRTLTVHLQGVNPGGYQFHGSGVIYKTDATGGSVWILTAAHNLQKWRDNDEAFTSFDAVKEAFIGAVRVYVTAPRGGNMETMEFTVDALAIHKGNRRYGYDVCALEVWHQPLANAVRSWLKWNQGYNLSDDTTSLNLVPDVERLVTDRQQTEVALEEYKVVHLGYGVNGGKNALRERAFDWRTIGGLAYHDRVWATEHGDQRNHRVLVFAAREDGTDDEATTTAGDSGGPAFLIGRERGNYDPRRMVYLLGVTLGANQYPDRWTGNGELSENNAITIVSQAQLDKIPV